MFTTKNSKGEKLIYGIICLILLVMLLTGEREPGSIFVLVIMMIVFFMNAL